MKETDTGKSEVPATSAGGMDKQQAPVTFIFIVAQIIVRSLDWRVKEESFAILVFMWVVTEENYTSVEC